MLPELIVTVIAAFYLGSLIDFREEQLTRITKVKTAKRSGLLSGIAGLLIAGALIFDVAAIFSKLQDAETGEFSIVQISTVNWMAVLLVSAAAAVLAAAIFFFTKTTQKKQA